MRSSKSRSRNKSNRNRSMGNIVNRVFDSSGPEGKVRGTPQQIIDKYLQLARDAHLSNDRVAAENFQQHAEHYTRMLGEATREQEARREAQEQQQQQQIRGRFGDGTPDPGSGDQPEVVTEPEAVTQHTVGDDNGVIDVAESADTGLVETPEMAAAEVHKPKTRRTRRPKAQASAEPSDGPGDGGGEGSETPPQEAAE